VAAAPERKLDSASLNAAAADHGGEVYAAAEQNSQARAEAAKLAAVEPETSDPSQLYKQYARSHEGTKVAAAPERKLDSASLNAAAADHGGEVYAAAEQNSKARAGAAKLSAQLEQAEAISTAENINSARSGSGKLHDQLAAAEATASVSADAQAIPAMQQDAAVQRLQQAAEANMPPGFDPVAVRAQINSLQQTQGRQSHFSFDQLKAQLRRDLGTPAGYALDARALHSNILHQGLTLSAAKEPEVLYSLQRDPAKTVIVMCGLTISPAETMHLIRDLLLPNLPVSTCMKNEISREIIISPTVGDIQRIRDMMVRAVTVR